MLTGFTLVWLCVYFPLETYASLAGEGVFTFGYLIDLVGMALMAGGLVATHRRHPGRVPLLVAGWAWTAANFWRATMERFWSAGQGQALQFGPSELWLGPILTALAIVGMVGAVAEAWRAGTRAPARQPVSAANRIAD